MASCGSKQTEPPTCNTCDDCLEVVKTTKTVQVPCTFNRYKQVTVKVPREVTKKIPRTSTYTTYETRQKQVPYTVNKSERRTRKVTRKYQVPVKRCYIDYVTRERQVDVPYFVNVPETKYRTESYQVPVQKNKTTMETVTKTVYDTKVKRRCVAETRMCQKELPVYNAVAKPCGECSADDILDGSGVSVKDGSEQISGADATNDVVTSVEQQANGSVTGSVGRVSAAVTQANANGNGDAAFSRAETMTGYVREDPWKYDEMQFNIVDAENYNPINGTYGSRRYM